MEREKFKKQRDSNETLGCVHHALVYNEGTDYGCCHVVINELTVKQPMPMPPPPLLDSKQLKTGGAGGRNPLLGRG